jgi:hypothetical protein
MQVPPRQGFEFAAAKLWSRVHRRATLLMLLVVALAAMVQPGCQAAAAVTLLVKAGRLLDPRSGQVLAPAAVVVEVRRSRRSDRSRT